MSPHSSIDLNNPAEVARETLHRLANERIAPTPDAYRDIYQQITGEVASLTAEGVLTQFAASISTISPDLADFGKQLNHALANQDWSGYNNTLKRILNQIKQQDALRKKSLPRPKQNQTKGSIEALAIRQSTSPATIESIPTEEVRIRILRELLHRTLSYALSTLLQDAPELATEAESLAQNMQEAFTEAALQEVSVRLKQLCFKITLKSGDMAEKQELVRQLLTLLLNNVNELIGEKSSLTRKIDGVYELMSGPITHATLKQVTRNLKNIIFQQGILKQNLAEMQQQLSNSGNNHPLVD
jgi:diguanylate cyclase